MDSTSVRSLEYIGRQLAARKVEAPTIDAGLSLLPKEVRREIRREAKRIAREDTFGVGHKLDKEGNPVEQGRGSPGNMTAQCIEQYIKNQTDRNPTGKPEAGYEETLKRMRAQLAECDARRRAERAAADADDDE